MALSFKDLIQSQQFTFYVDTEGKPIIVHADAIAATSDYFQALIKNGMSESETRCAKIEDVALDDFVRFCEYAYRGDYTVPSSQEDLRHEGSPPIDDRATPKDKKKSKKSKTLGRGLNVEERTQPEPRPAPILEPPPEPAPEVELTWGDFATPAVKHPKKPSPSRAELRRQFDTRHFLGKDDPKAQILQNSEPKPNTVATQDFKPVLLAHARLYSFAHTRLVGPLQALTLDKLHKTLKDFSLYTERVRDIIELARFAYTNPNIPDRDSNGKIDALRELVLEYVLCEIDTVGKTEDFVRFMEEGGEFVGDFWKLARAYIT